MLPPEFFTSAQLPRVRVQVTVAPLDSVPSLSDSSSGSAYTVTRSFTTIA